MSWESVIGLEIHVQLKTKSKIFSGAATAYGAEPNTQADYVSAALPGVLPVMNKEAARLAIKFGLAVGAQVNQRSEFSRKNYFYPDLPKGYQISQFEQPIVGTGTLTIDTSQGEKTIGITRAHLEEDAGKSLHDDFQGMSGIDLNRAGTPLIEIVSDPDMRSAEEAVAYLRKIHHIVTYLGICDGNMQEGSFRCDANVSVRKTGDDKLGTRAELKNINSFRFVERAIEIEIERQIDVIEAGGEVVQETRLYDENRDETRAMRSKADAHDYRYFPDPDLPTLVISDEMLAAIKSEMPELPDVRKQRYLTDFALNDIDASKLVESATLADFFDDIASKTKAPTKTVANWINGEFSAYLNRDNISISQATISAEQFTQLLDRIEDGTISGKIAKDVFQDLISSDDSVDAIIDAKGLRQISDSGAIEKIIDDILAGAADQVAQYKEGNQKVFGFFVGQVMRASQGKANPKQVNEILRKKLDA